MTDKPYDPVQAIRDYIEYEDYIDELPLYDDEDYPEKFIIK